METKTDDAIAVSNLLSRTLKKELFYGLLPEAQTATLTEVETLLEQPDLLLTTKRQLMSYLKVIAADCRLSKEIKAQAVKLVEPWLNPGF